METPVRVCHQVWHFYANLLHSQLTWRREFVDADTLWRRVLQRFDVVVIFPGGSAHRQAAALGVGGAHVVRRFVHEGGGYVGICAGAFLATAKYDWSLGLINAKTITGQQEVPGLGVKSLSARGAGIVQMEFTHAGRMVFGDFPSLVEVRYAGGPILSPAGRYDLPEYVVLARYRTEVWDFEAQRGRMIGSPAVIAARFGKGRVIAFSPHPEMTEGLESLIRQAILWVTRPQISSALPSTHRSPDGRIESGGVANVGITYRGTLP